MNRPPWATTLIYGSCQPSAQDHGVKMLRVKALPCEGNRKKECNRSYPPESSEKNVAISVLFDRAGLLEQTQSA